MKKTKFDFSHTNLPDEIKELINDLDELTERMREKMFVRTLDVVRGDVIRFKEAVFAGSYRKPEFLGERKITAEVLRESYGEEKQQHTFILRVISAEVVSDNEGNVELPNPGDEIMRKGRNIYKFLCERRLWTDENARLAVTREKHKRGDCARAERDARRDGEF